MWIVGYFRSCTSSQFQLNSCCPANSSKRQPMAYWLSFPHLKQWLHHCSPFARNFEHLGEHSLTSCLPCPLLPVHLFPLPSLDWEDVPDLALTSVLSASTAALSSWKFDLVLSVDLGSSLGGSGDSWLIWDTVGDLPFHWFFIFFILSSSAKIATLSWWISSLSSTNGLLKNGRSLVLMLSSWRPVSTVLQKSCWKWPASYFNGSSPSWLAKSIFSCQGIALRMLAVFLSHFDRWMNSGSILQYS